MSRLLFLLSFFSFSVVLFAGSFDTCHKNVKKSYKFSQNKHFYHTKYGWLVYSKVPLKSFDRSEPLLGLYLFNDKNTKGQLKVLNRYPKDVAAISFETKKPNRIINEGLGIDKLAQLKYHTFSGAGIFGSCCTLRGINTDNGVITSDYILRFLKQEKRFASAGVRLKLVKGKLMVSDVNPFFASNPFKKGDEILYFDGAKLSLERLTKKILFSKIGSKHHFRIKRKGKAFKVSIFLKERLGGAILADTYLEHYGFQFDTDLRVVRVRQKSMVGKLGLLAGDRLKSINNISVTDDLSVRDLLAKAIKSEKIRLLIERDGLQFNIYLPSNIMLTL